MDQSLHVVILAAGKGTRMRSALPKVLHPLAGKPLLSHVIDTSRQLEASVHVVFGHGGELVPATINDESINWVIQKDQLGTGHAVEQALPDISNGLVLVLYGDVPLTRLETLKTLVSRVSSAQGPDLCLLTAQLDDPTGYGRIVRSSNGQVLAIVEQKDADDEILSITEINSGILCVRADKLKAWISQIESNNAQGEFYLTDIVALAVNDHCAVDAILADNIWEISGVNNKVQLAELERQHQSNIAFKLMTDGVTLADPSRIDVRGNLSIAKDIFIDVNCVFSGDIHLGNNVSVGPGVVLENCIIGDNTRIFANSVLSDCKIGSNCNIGPFARVRPDSVLANNVNIGNFVEIKKTSVDSGSKINHLSYVGDAVVGSGVNIGAGTITCNYDGANKHTTVIEDDVFVGSDTQLVAPVCIQKGSTIGAGSTITKDTPAEKLTLSRSRQTTIQSWTRPTKS